MKYLIILLLTFTLSSCFQQTDQNVFVVEKVIFNEDYCTYQIQSYNVLQFDLNGACGLYQAGDTLKLIKK